MPNKANNISAARKVYETYWESYAKGDLETFASTLDDNYEMIGTSESEICHSKADGIAFFKGQMHEVVGKAEMRNRQIDVLPVDNLILVNEQCDVYVLVDSAWNFYSKIRISSFLRENESGWKVIQQHGSLPDMRVGEGETLAIDKINRENLELRDAVKRRTAELESKNKELAIESALERVRSRTMAMQNSNELSDVVSALYQQMETLGFAKYGCELILCNEKSGLLEYWHTNPMQSSVPECYCVSPEVHAFFKKVWKAWKQKTPMLVIEMKNQEKRKLDVALLEKTDFKRLDKKTKNWILKEKVAVFSHVTMKYGLLVTIDSIPISAEQLSILHRFAKVFEQTYTRFLDLQKAEAQAKEAKIEAALERVRSRSMAMHKTDELQEVVRVVAEELKNTGVILDTWGAVICTYFQDSKDVLHWTASEDPANPSIAFLLPYFKDELFDEAWESKERGDSYFAKVFSFEVKNAFFNHAFEHSDYRQLPDGYKKQILESETHGIAWAWAKNSAIMIPSIQGDLPSEDEKEILIRFARVFEQSFIRFLDLQKAEAQAREAQIETALERVRSASMAMHKSDELLEVVNTVFERLRELNLPIDAAAIFVFEQNGYEYWFATADSKYPTGMHLPERGNQVVDDISNARETQVDFISKLYSFDDKNNFFHNIFENTDFRNIPDERKKFLLECESLSLSVALEKNSGIQLNSYTGKVLSPKEIDVLKRFTRVFEQAYTRFLDLQKAEAQAREAQIEAALERVRAQAMAMHQSEDLGKTIMTYYEQLDNLIDSTIVRCGAGLLNKENTIADMSTASKSPEGETYHVKGRIDMQGHPLLENTYAHWLQQKEYNHVMRGSEIKEYYQYITNQVAIPENKGDDELHFYFPMFTEGSFYVVTNNAVPESELQIFRRFSSVLSLTYRRFNDLQKAEAQAREAQVEAALERVRSKTMAMHSSADVDITVITLFEELIKLGVDKSIRSGIGIWNQSRIVEVWTGSINPISGQTFLDKGILDLGLHPLLTAVKDAWEAKKSAYTYELVGDDLMRYFKAVNDAPDYSIQVDFEKLPEKIIHYDFFFPDGFLFAFSPVPFSEETERLFSRFAAVFAQTYRRFLDLQKAEAQAREAQIEVAVERVRAQSMAMHHPDDLDKVNKEILNQLNQLQIPGLTGVSFYLINENGWVKAWDFSSPGNIGAPNSYTLQYDFNTYEMMGEPFRVLRQSDQDYFIADYTLDKLKKAVYELEEINPAVAKAFQEAIASGVLTHQWVVCAKISNGILGVDVVNPPNKDTQIIVVKMAGAFNQAYTRFLDLQKAEAQAREAQIEAALERVRALTMAMHNSEDVGKCVIKMFSELTALGVHEGTRFGIGILNHDNENIQLWTARKDGEDVNMHIGNLDMTWHPLLRSARKAWKEHVPLHRYVLEGEDLVNYYQMINHAPDYKLQVVIEKLPEREFHYGFIFDKGFFYAFSPREFQPELIHITQRFTKVFEQTYTRFLDLQKAEAQAREAKIETALEKVRSRTMGMQSSEELPEVANLLFTEVRALGIPAWSCGYNILAEDKKTATCIMSSEGTLQTPFQLRLWGEASFDEMGEFIRSEKTFLVQELGDNAIDEHYAHMRSFPDLKPTFDELDRLGLSLPTYQINHLCKFTQGFLLFITYEKVPDAFDIFKRFTKVFEQTYTRFLDLKKAEAQAREAQIETALERVRSRSMAMHKSEELLNVITVVSEQLQQLNFKFNTVSFAINSQQHDYTFWFAILGDANPIYIQVPYLENPMFDRLKEALAQGIEFHADTLTPEESREWHEHVFMHAEVPMTEETKAYIQRSGYARSIAIRPSIMLVVSNYAGKPYSDSENEIIKRFATVFEQSYTRFLDLKKAEAQAREAQIEASLERVRSRAMAMRKSDELKEVIVLIFKEFRKLGFDLFECNILIFDSAPRSLIHWGSGTNDSEPNRVYVPYFDHPFLRELFNDLDRGIKLRSGELSGALLQTYFDRLFTETDFKYTPQEYIDSMRKIEQVYYTHAVMSHGFVEVVGSEPLSKENIEILERFTRVVDLTYTRFDDVVRAEQQAREAVRQASLDRVRAEIASMRTTIDLERITPLIWKELTTLNIPFIRCGVFIMDEPLQQIHTFLSTPDGKAIAAFHLPYDAPGRTREILASWNNKQMYIEHWDETAFSELGDLLVQQGAVPSKDAYLNTVPQGGIHLHCLPFMQGMLYVGNTVKLNEDDIQLIQSVADAFATAYARYEDFNKLEVAKQQVDKALVDLKQTQQQLVQSEKMASLGELTAGIAHEIQNPLNFVNNFSEVSNELLDEMKEEIERGNVEDAKAIALDVKQNLEKILHHGKRADGIVKGMLQHSRSSSGTKELTDLNALADEYLRLAYHGLRAKDKSFNAKFETHFDESLEKVEVVPQDIGRVILNLITNAFYVVSEKKKQMPEGYEPTVIVSSRIVDGKVVVSVKDNGSGIPQKVLDKIFQPFFTTKPTGQGTGLGLSLSYDIVKAHGGELRVETREGEGSEFIIVLPV
jgi:signal transduction histidine kinase